MSEPSMERSPLPYDFDTPPGWRLVERRLDGVAWRRPGGAVVIASAEQIDGERWVHLSMSKKSGLPTWPELVAMRDVLLGEDAEAYQVCPPKDRYVNLHDGVLHLWSCLDRPRGVLPAFDGVVDGTRTI